MARATNPGAARSVGATLDSPAALSKLDRSPAMESSAQDGPVPEPGPAAGEDGQPRLGLGLARVPGWRGELLILLALLLAACVLTWPLVISLGQATGLRGDYFNNLWNAWWVKHSITHGHSPYWTDYLYYPEGISLRRHTLSPLNSLALAGLTSVLDQHAAFSLVVLLHCALSAWCFSLFARHVTGSTAGGVLAGLVYSFCPFHYFYLCQINVFSFEFLPLGLLFFVKHYREGGARNLAGVALSLAGMVVSAEYYVVYAYMAMAILVPCARVWAPEVPFAAGMKRTLKAGALGALVVALVAFPLLYATLGPERGTEAGTAAFAVEKHRTNDLFGFYWIGPKEESIVSWPTMLGYSTLALILIGARRPARFWPWLLIGLFFFVLSLGSSLVVGGNDTGFPMPYALFEHVPVLSMLRKSDRAFMMVQLIVSLAVAWAWSNIAARVGKRGGLLWAACASVLMLELSPVPLGRFEIPTSPYLSELARQQDVHAVMDLPAARTHVANGRFDFLQTLHEKKSTLGYTTALAVTPFHDRRVEDMVNWYWQFLFGVNRILARQAAQLGVQRIVHYKTFPVAREREWIDGRTLWAPFFFVRDPLVRVRQLGEFQAFSLDATFSEVVGQVVPELLGKVPADRSSQLFLDVVRSEFGRAFGPPVHEDDEVMVFAVPERK